MNDDEMTYDYSGDELLPNDGESFYKSDVQKERDREEQRERAIIEQAGPLLEHIFVIIDKHIESVSSINSIDLESKVDPVVQMLANQHAVEKFNELRADLQIMRDNTNL